jgi:hypothetical protein
MVMNVLILEVVEFIDLTRWRWTLRDISGRLLGEHFAFLDPKAVEYEGFIDLPKFVSLHAASEAPEDERAPLERFGNWLTSSAFGALAPTMASYGATTVRILVPPGAEALVLCPFESATINGKPLSLSNIVLVFEVTADPLAPVKRGIGDKLRVLAVFSLPPVQSPLNLRTERRALRQLTDELVGSGDPANIELRTLQYGTTRESFRDILEDGDGWDVLHFSGHGIPGKLIFEKQDGSTDVVSADELAALLFEHRTKLKSGFTGGHLAEAWT